MFKCRCVRKIPKGTTPISIKGIKRKRFKDFLIWSWTINKKKVQDAFRGIFKRDIGEKDFPLLIKHHTLKMDKVLYGENFVSLLSMIEFDYQDMENMEKIIYVRSQNDVNKFTSKK